MLKIDDLSFGYKNKQLFDGLELNMPAGHIYGLLGKNGAGKSTLLKLIAGLLFPQRGKIDVAGFNPGDRTPQFLSEVFLVAEEFELPAVTMEQYLKLYSPFYPRFSKELFDHYITELEVAPNSKLQSLSMGQKKKFLLSFGLATDSSLLILDEPTNGLDIPAKSKFRQVVANAIHEDRTFVISTHQARDMENLIDPIIILDEGEVVFFHDFEQVSQKLTFERMSQLPKDGDFIYAEPTFGGFTVVKKNQTGVETNMNMELLFNAVVNGKEKMYEAFKN